MRARAIPAQNTNLLSNLGVLGPPLMEWMAPAPGIAMCHIGRCHANPRREVRLKFQVQHPEPAGQEDPADSNVVWVS